MLLSMSWTVDFLAAVVVFCIAFYYWWTAPYDYWKKKNIPYIEPSFPFGSIGDLFFGKTSITQLTETFYSRFKSHGFGGTISMRSRVLVICDPELIKHVLIKDFSAFHSRGLAHDEESDPFSAHLFNLEGEAWKRLRTKLSPTFSSGKIKGMFPLIYDCTQNLTECVQTVSQKNGSVEMKELLFQFTSDVIGSCAFGIDCNSLKDRDSTFHQMGQAINGRNFANIFRTIVTTIWPKTAKYLTFKRIFPTLATFFTDLMNSTVKYRRENDIHRNDFVQLVMKVMDDDPKGFSQELMTAQAMVFFLAGVDNVANNVGFCLHEMALNQELQERVYQEVQRVLQEFDGNNCYEAIGKMDLLQRVLDEGFRKYTPLAAALARQQNADTYVIPGTDVVVDKGITIMVPTQAIHKDEEYFPNPHKFDPDRFTEEEKKKRHPCTFLPFGDGPRICIAKRFAELEMRLCFAELMRHFHFNVAPETDLSLEMDSATLNTTPKKGFWLRVSKRN